MQLKDKCKSCKYSTFSFNGDTVHCKVIDNNVTSIQECPLLYPTCELCSIYDNCGTSFVPCKDFKLKDIESEDNWYD